MTPLIKKDGPGAALLSITCLITPRMMKERGGNLVISKSLMSFWFGAAPADCEDRTRKVSVSSEIIPTIKKTKNRAEQGRVFQLRGNLHACIRAG